MLQLVAELTARLPLRQFGLQTIAHQASGPQTTVQPHLFGQVLVEATPAHLVSAADVIEFGDVA